jgi:DNA-binding CsgD family transcriptional regulator
MCYFVRLGSYGWRLLKNIPRPTGIIVQGNIPWGTHLCLFHESKQDLLNTMVPYFRAGLENREFCLWILQPRISRQDALQALRRGVPDFDRYMSEGSIELIPQSRWFAVSGRFETAAVVQRFRVKLEDAISRGYAGLRVNGSPAWLHAADPTTFRDFERKLDELIAGEKMIVVCSFSLSDSDATLVLDAARTHKFTAALRDGAWEVIETHDAGRSDSQKHTSDETNAAGGVSASMATLTQREQAVLAQIVAGASNKEAARRLEVTARTIEFHRANILQKLGAKNTADLIRIVLTG